MYADKEKMKCRTQGGCRSLSRSWSTNHELHASHQTTDRLPHQLRAYWKAPIQAIRPFRVSL